MRQTKTAVLVAVVVLCAMWSKAQVQVTGTLVVQGSQIAITFPVAFVSMHQGLAFSSAPQISGGQGPYTCTWTGSFPAGITSGGTNGCTVSGTPTGTSSATSTVTVTDNFGQTKTGSVTMLPSSLSTVTVSATSQIVAIGSTQQYTCKGTWNDNSQLDLTAVGAWTSSSPSIATVGASTGVVTGVAAGTSTIQCSYNPGTGAVTGTLGVTVPSASPAISSPATLPSGQNGITYPPYTLTATGGAAPYTWAIISGSLPTPMILTGSTGVISGTPTGTSQTFTLRVTDSLTATTTKVMTLNIATVSANAASCVPAIITVGSTTPCVSTTTFSDASTANTTQGSAIRIIGTASGGSSDAVHNSVVTATPLNVAVGDTLWLMGSHGTDTTSTITPSDTAANTPTTIGSLTSDAGIGAAQHFFIPVTVANANDFVTATFNNPVRYDTINVVQFRGLLASPVDQHTETVATNPNNCTPSAITTTQAIEVIVGGCRPGNFQTFSPSAGFSLDTVDPTSQQATQSQLVSSIQTSITPGITYNNSTTHNIAFLASLKAAATGGAAWSSTVNCTVDSNGNVEGKTVGSCTITAIFGGQTGTATVTVNPPSVTRIDVCASSPGCTPPITVSGAQGATQQFVASDQSGNVITGSVTWASSVTSCATVNASGLATIVSSSACSSAISATLNAVVGAATFQGTGPQATQGLLTGCGVNANNTIALGVNGCPASVPAGWTQVSAVSFEDNTFGGGGAFKTNVPYAIVTNFGHVGTHSLQGLISKDDATISWSSPNLAGTKDTYISYWEYDDANGLQNTEVYMAGVDWGALQFLYYDSQQLGQCGNSTIGNNTKGNMMPVFGGSVGPTTSGQDYGHQTGCLSLNAPAWGNWTQWEVRVRINDPAPIGQTSNGQWQLYRNGVLVTSTPPNSGACNSTGYPCSNLSGTTDLGAAFHQAVVGGVSTTLLSWKDAAKTICAAPGDNVLAQDRPQSFASISPCPLQEPPNGYFNSTAPGGWHRYFDDIIVLKR